MKQMLAIFCCCLLLTPLALPCFALEGQTVHVKTIADLEQLSAQCVLDTWSEGKTVLLEADLDLTGADFSPIAQFAGTFRGGGHTISGLRLTNEGSILGLFRKVLPGGVVENLHVEGELWLEGASETVGGICGENRGVLRNCSFTGTVHAYRAVGGVCGSNAAEGVLENCSAFGEVSGQHRVGGIVGETAGLVRSCQNSATVNADAEEEIIPETLDLQLSTEELIDITDVGGIAGRCAGVLRSCENHASVGHQLVGYNVGGIVGHLSGSVSGCKNHAAVLGRKDVGGIVGQIDPSRQWSFSTEKLDTLQEKLAALNGSVNRLTGDAASLGVTLSGEFASLTGALSGAIGSADRLSDEAAQYLNENIASVNALSGRIQQTLASLAPVLSELTGVSEPLPEVFTQLYAAIVSLYEAGAVSGEVYNDLLDAWGRAQAAMLSAKQTAQALQEVVSAFLQAPNLEEAGAMVSRMISDLQSIRQALSTAKAALLEMNGILTALSGTGDPLEQALAHADAATDGIVSALSALDTAAELLSAVSDQVAGYQGFSISFLNSDSAGAQALFSSLGQANEAFRVLSSHLGEPTLAEDVKAVSDGFYALSECLLDLVSERSARDLVQVDDISAAGQSLGTAAVASCLCDGSVEAQTNVGGIVGAISIELAFDLEDEYNLSALAAGGARYLIYASVRSCESSADVYAKKEAAGGIAGRMDYGALALCRASGSIRTEGDYAGGIAGQSAGDISACMARAELSGAKYVGGIAGLGADLSDCDSLPSFREVGPYFGAIAGDAEGTVTGCRYAGSALGAVNGFSYAGQAEQVTLETLLRSDEDTALLRTVTVRFFVEGALFSEIRLPYGGRLEQLPAVPDKDGKRWQWDAFDQTAVRTDLLVEGSYLSPIYTLSDGQSPALVLVEGLFEQGQSLTVLPLSTDGLALTEGRTVLSAATLRVDGDTEVLTVHLRGEAGATLYVGRDGNYIEQPFTTDGSYLVFPLENGESYLLLSRKAPLWPSLLVCVPAMLGIAVLVLGLRRRIRRKAAAKQAPAPEPPQEEIM